MEDAKSEQLSRRLTRMVQRKRYDRLPLDSSRSRFAVRMPRKLKVANLDLGRGSLSGGLDLDLGPTLRGDLREVYATVLADAKLENSARPKSVVPVHKGKSLSVSHTQCGIPPEIELGFTLLEHQYSDHLKSAFDGRYV